METSVLTVLAFSTFGLLILVSGGIIYLTLIEWRDRRRQDRERRENKPSRRRSTKV